MSVEQPPARHTERALADSEIRLQQIVDNTGAVVFAKDADGRYLFVNREFERVTGLDSDLLLGRTDDEVLPKDLAARFRNNDLRALQEGRCVTVEESADFGAGMRTFVSCKFPLLDSDGAAYAVCGMATDITERKRLEEAFSAAALAVSQSEKETLYRQLARYLSTILGVDGAFIAVPVRDDQTSMRMLAFHLDGETQEDFDYPLAGTPCESVMGQQFRCYPSQLERLFPLDPGSRAFGFVSYAGQPLTGAGGTPLGLIAVVSRRPFQDPALIEATLRIFAVRVNAELERAAAAAALRASEENYRQIFESSEDAIYVHHWDTGLLVDVNRKACESRGYTREALLQLSPEDLMANQGQYTLDEATRRIEETKRTGSARFEWLSRNADGRINWDDVRLKSVEIGGQPRILAFVRDITDRKQAEEKLRASEEQYRTIFNASVDALLLKNENHEIVDVNAAYLAMHGYTREQMIGRRLSEFIPAELQAQCEILLPGILTGQPCRLEARSRRADGTTFDVEINGTPMTYLGRPHALVMMRDITDRKQAEEALRASEEQYRAIFNATSDALILWDSKFRRVDVNTAYERTYGWRREEVLGRGCEHLPYGEEYAVPRQDMVRRALAGEACTAELEAIRKDGEHILTEVHAIPFRHRGEPHVLAVARDVTERRRAEEKLRASEARYRAIFTASADAMTLWDSQFRRVDVNPAYERMLGWTREEVIGRGWEFPAFSADHEESRENLVRRALAGETLRGEHDVLRKDGTRIRAEVQAIPFQHNGQPHVLIIARDITERSRAESQRQELEARLRQAQKMEAIGQLTGGIAHDFNNLLTSIMGYVTLAGDRDAALGDARLAGYLEQARRSCERARDLIQQMLMFSRGQRGSPRAVSLSSVLQGALPTLRAGLPDSLELSVDAQGSDVPVYVDPAQVEQVLLNLCINARDATDGIGHVRIGVHALAAHSLTCSSCRQTATGSLVELVVEDDGQGMEPGLIERIFEPFFSTKEAGKGSGMGLAMVHGIVHEHGGHVIVESRPGEGARFRVVWPVARLKGEASRAESPVDTTGRASRPVLKGSVLVVDDEETVGGFMRELLATWGLEVACAARPLDALELLRSAPRRFDLVITDQSMPKMTGIELARRLKELRPDLPVILYTGHGEGLADDDVTAARVSAVIRKPVDPALLSQCVARCLAPATVS